MGVSSKAQHVSTTPIVLDNSEQQVVNSVGISIEIIEECPQQMAADQFVAEFTPIVNVCADCEGGLLTYIDGVQNCCYLLVNSVVCRPVRNDISTVDIVKHSLTAFLYHY